MTFTEREINVIAAVMLELSRMHDDDLNRIIGSETIKDVHKLSSKLYHREYCDKHGIRFEDMTDADFEQAYFERFES